MIDKKNPLALYLQVKQIMLSKINDGDWKVGDKIPSETELCEQYNISRITARRAMAELEQDGLIERKPGKGSFVKFKGISQELSKFYSFTEEMKLQGYTPNSRLISIDEVYPDEEIRSALNMEIEEKVYLIKRLRLADGEIIVIDRSYLPRSLFPELDKFDFEQHSLYQILKDHYGVDANMAEETFDAILVNKEDAEFLGTRRNAPALLIKRVTYSGDIPIEYNHRIVNRDKYKYKVVLR